VTPDSASRAHAAFVQRFGSEPAQVATAPGRVNIIGDHTDYNEGYVFPVPIPLTCAVPASPSNDRAFRVFAADLNQSATFPLDAVAAGDLASAGLTQGSWQSYVFGVLHELAAWLQGSNRTSGCLNFGSASDVAVGSGLSSSAAPNRYRSRPALPAR
jgi:galactokinase